MSQQISTSKEHGQSKKTPSSPSIDLPEKWINSMLKTVGMYPLSMIRTLIQLGYEPLPPTFGHSFSGHPRLYLPNVLTYGSYVRDVDGFFGVYRGFSPYVGYELTKICSEYLLDTYYDDYIKISAYIDIGDNNSNTITPIHYSDEDDYENNSKLLSAVDNETINELRKCKKELIISMISTAVSHPLRVIATRTIAEFVGHENLYTNVSNSIAEIYTHEGLSGFFAGLYSALLGCACFIAGSTLIYLSSLHLLRKYTDIHDKQSVKTFLKFGSALVSSYSCFPLNTVTTAMMINGSRLRIAQADSGFPFKSSYECYRYLKNNGRLYRGSSLFFRRQL